MKINNETKIGLMIVMVFVFFTILTMKAGNVGLKKEGYAIKVDFQDIDGVSLNSPVMFNGLEIGIVEDIKIVNGEHKTSMELTLWLEHRVQLRQGSKAYVKLYGFMGEKYIGLTSGHPNAEVLDRSHVLKGQDPADIAKLMQNGQDISEQIKEITENLNERLKVNKTNVDSILTSLNRTSNSLVNLVEHLDQRLIANEKNIDTIITNVSQTTQHLNSTSVHLEEMTEDLKHNPWKILHRSKEK